MFTEFSSLDKDETDAFTFGFSRWLETSETISSFTFPDFPADLTLVGSSNTTVDVTARISVNASSPQTSYNVTCRVVTNGGRTKDLTGTIPIADA